MLLQAAAQGLDDGPELGLLHELAVGGPGGAADVLVHQRPAEVDPGQQGLADPSAPIFTHDTWMLSIRPR